VVLGQSFIGIFTCLAARSETGHCSVNARPLLAYPALRRLAKRALCPCVDQPYDDMKEFLLAYASAFAQKPTGPGLNGIGSSAFAIYNFMLFYWRIIDRLNSVHHLHEVLVKVFGPYRTGDQKRTEKICQRIGLHYRKPGRPKKIETIQTLA
jgi:hypothetical protein